MVRKKITGIILDIFNQQNEHLKKYNCSHYDGEITEYTKLINLNFDSFEQTTVLLNIDTEFETHLKKEDIFNFSNRICDIIDLIETKTIFDDYCKTCHHYRSYYFNIKCNPDHSNCLKMVENKPFCDYYVKKDENDFSY